MHAVTKGNVIVYSKHKVVTTESLDSDVKVPAVLNLPFGKLFFGFNVAAYTPPPAAASPSAASPVSENYTTALFGSCGKCSRRLPLLVQG